MTKSLKALFLALLVFGVACGPAYAASTFTSAQASGHNLYQPPNGGTATVTATYEVTTALVIDDVIQMVAVPKDCTVVDLILVVDDLDTGTTIVLDVGTGADDAYFIDGSTAGQAAAIARMSEATAFPLALTARDTVDVHVDAAPTGGGIGTITLTVTYIYTP